jgi:hypothetical protein
MTVAPLATSASTRDAVPGSSPMLAYAATTRGRQSESAASSSSVRAAVVGEAVLGCSSSPRPADCCPNRVFGGLDDLPLYPLGARCG